MDEKQIAELQRGLYYLGEHIHLLEIWARRGDTNPDLCQQVELTREQFNAVAKILPPKDQ